MGGGADAVELWGEPELADPGSGCTSAMPGEGGGCVGAELTIGDEAMLGAKTRRRFGGASGRCTGPSSKATEEGDVGDVVGTDGGRNGNTVSSNTT